ncbi:MAG: putative toxin-antitoxin system toxin component, PIN family [Syntrophobacteraceae bacterium]
MIKVVLDANQFVSALLKPHSNPAKIARLVYEGDLTLLLSPAILDELQRVLSYPKIKKLHCRTPEEIERFFQKLKKIAIITPGILSVSEVIYDPSDNIYLACAVEGNAGFIVSSDHHITDLKTFLGIPIVNPATLLKLIAGQDKA